MRHLSLRWALSRAQGYAGQNVVTVRDSETGKAFRQYGGGFDLERAALSEWLQVTHQDKLRAIRDRCRVVFNGIKNGEHKYNDAPNALEGMGTFPNSDDVVIDVGRDSDIDQIATAIGIAIVPVYKRSRGRSTRVGWDVAGC